jgi:hypothetical protein
MTNVQKAYDAVYREGKGGASFNMVFHSLGTFSPRWETKVEHGGEKGITWFKGRRAQLREYDGQRLLQKSSVGDTFWLFIAAKEPNQRKFRYYKFMPYAIGDRPLFEEVNYLDWWGK